MMSDGTKVPGELPVREQTEIMVEAAMQLIPFGLGSYFATVWFGQKNENRFRRIEAAYAEIAEHVRERGEEVAEVVRASHERSDPEYLAALLEGFHERVEAEVLESKREHYVRFFEDALLSPVDEANYDERRLVLDVLAALSPVQLQIVSAIASRNEWVDPKEIKVPGVSRDVVEGAVGLLKSYGVLDERTVTTTVTRERGIVSETVVHLSGFGYRLHYTCLAERDESRPDIRKQKFRMTPVPDEKDVYQSETFELTDEEVESWFEEVPLRGRPTAGLIDRREPVVLDPGDGKTTIRLRPSIAGRWIVDWRVTSGGETTTMALSPGLERVLQDKKPGYVAPGEEPFRHEPAPSLGPGAVQSENFVLTDEEMDRALRADFSQFQHIVALYERRALIPLEDREGWQLFLQPGPGAWLVNWIRTRGAPLKLPPVLRSILETKEPHPNSNPRSEEDPAA